MKKFRKKALSLLLSVLMLLSPLVCGTMVLFASADSTGRITSSGYNIVIGVPETVYMTPQNNYSTTTTSVKYYVNNTVSTSGGVSLDQSNSATAGKFYIYSPQISSVSSVTVNGKYGILTLNTDGSIDYKPTNMLWNAPDEFTFTLSCAESIINAPVNIYPQTNVLYEETSVKFGNQQGSGSNMKFTEDTTSWKSDTSIVPDEKSSSAGVYGYSNAYAKFSNYSDGTAKWTTVKAGEKVYPTYTFTFIGTGVDIIGKCDENSGLMLVSLTDANGNRVGMNKAINTHCADTIYQEVVYHKDNLTYGKYTVTVTVSYNRTFDLTPGSDVVQAGYDTVVPENGSIVDLSAVLGEEYAECEYFCMDSEAYRSGNDDIIDFEPVVVQGANPVGDASTGDYNVTIDGVRVYNPGDTSISALRTQYENDNEYNPTYKLLTTIFEENSKKTSDNTISNPEFKNGSLYVESDNSGIASWADYKKIGSNTEIQLRPGTDGIAFEASGYDRLHISFRSTNGQPCTAVINGHEIAINSTTEQYYDVTDYIKDDKLAIACKGAMLSICSFKYFASTSSTQSSGEEIVLFEATEGALLNASRMFANMEQPEAEEMTFTVDFGDSASTTVTVPADRFTVTKVGNVWTAKAELSNEELVKLIADSKNIKIYDLNEEDGITLTATYEDGVWTAQTATFAVNDKTPEADEIMVFFVDFGQNNLTEVRVNKKNVKVEKIDGVWTATATLSKDSLDELLEEAGISDEYEVDGKKVTLSAKMVGDEWHSDVTKVTVKKLSWIEKFIKAIENFFKVFAERLTFKSRA